MPVLGCPVLAVFLADADVNLTRKWRLAFPPDERDDVGGRGKLLAPLDPDGERPDDLIGREAAKDRVEHVVDGLDGAGVAAIELLDSVAADQQPIQLVLALSALGERERVPWLRLRGQTLILG